MTSFKFSVLRGVAVAVALFATMDAKPLVAGPSQTGSSQVYGHEPFASGILIPSGGGLLEKWLTVWRQWGKERQEIARCRHNPSQCDNPAAMEFLEMVEKARSLQGLAQLGEINRAVNLSLKPVSDLANYGTMDVWSSPLGTLGRHAGDCEDFAILKFAALLEAGIAPEDLRVLIVRDANLSEDHAVVVARFEAQWLVLDNRRLVMLADFQLGHYLPLVQMDARGARRYTGISVATGEREAGPPAGVGADAID